MKSKGNQQSDRLTVQQKAAGGQLEIFDKEAQIHDAKVGDVELKTLKALKIEFPNLTFRHRPTITKTEINYALRQVHKDLGQTIFLTNASIKPDGGIIEVKDDNANWRVVLISEAKFQGKDIDNIKTGTKVGKLNNQVLMAAGNAIERAHKNIKEIANYMLGETYFPYVLFLAGSNFLTQNVEVERPDGTKYTLRYDDGILNRLDRLTAANYGMPINTNLCQNKFITYKGNSLMLQAASIYTQGDGSRWGEADMLNVMLDVAKTSLRMLSPDLFSQLSNT